MPKVDPPLGQAQSKSLTLARAKSSDTCDLANYNKVELSLDGKKVTMTHAKDASKNITVQIENT